MTARLATTVVYRQTEYRFDVDGEPFPWHISEAGATFIKVRDLYLVTVQLFPFARSKNEALKVIVDYARNEPLAFEHVNGDRTPFPWFLSGDRAITVTLAPRDYPVVDLTFMAEHVNADVDIPEEGPVWTHVQENCLADGGHFWNDPEPGDNAQCTRCHWFGARNWPSINECNG